MAPVVARSLESMKMMILSFVIFLGVVDF